MGSDFSAWLFLCGRKCHANCKDIAIRCVAFSGGVEATSSSFCQRLSKFQNRVTVCEMTFFHAAATLPGIMKSYEILPYTSPTLDFQLRSILHLRRSTPEFYRFSSFFSLKTGKFHQGRGTPPQPLGCPAICSRQWRHGHSTDGKWKDSCFFGRFAILPKKKPWGITRLIEDAGGLYTICFVKCVLNWYHEMQSMQTTWNDLRLVIVSYIIYQCMYQCIYLYSYIIACVCVCV